MRYPKPESVNRRLVEDTRLSQKVRLAALESISRPPLALLLRLFKNSTTPSRLLALAAEKYRLVIWRRNLAKLPVEERRKRLREIVNDSKSTPDARNEALLELRALPQPHSNLLGIPAGRVQQSEAVDTKISSTRKL